MQSLSYGSFVALVGVLVGFYAIRSFVEYRRAKKDIQNHPGVYTFLDPHNVLSNILPPIPLLSLGRNHSLKFKHRLFESKGWDIYSHIATWPHTQTFLTVADAAAVKDIVASRARFPKAVQRYGVLSIFGENIVASEGEQWKRFRKISAPAFSDRNNRLVWDESIKIMLDMFDNVWENGEEIVVDQCVDITLPIALFVIGVAGFGRRISWKEDTIVPQGHKMTFKDALHVVSNDVTIKLVTPSWMFGLTKRLRQTRLAFDELEQYMLELIRERKTAEKKQERYDLFNSLLDANEDGDSSDGLAKLQDRELLGNIFIFMLAGHETTAHTLCFTFALLALYPEEQAILYHHIKKIVPDDRLPTYDEMPLFTQSMAVFYETLRMFPPAPGIPKVASEDSVLMVGNLNGQTKTIPVPQGAEITIDVPGLHYNPRYWDDPHNFRPARFLGDWSRDAFFPFSGGARACLGRKFFETEGIAILTMLVSRYKIEIKEEPEFASETFEERKARIFEANVGLTLTPVRVPLVFKRR